MAMVALLVVGQTNTSSSSEGTFNDFSNNWVDIACRMVVSGGRARLPGVVSILVKVGRYDTSRAPD
jgi:hypothetical protein